VLLDALRAKGRAHIMEALDALLICCAITIRDVQARCRRCFFKC
jgi:hypothetical protein